jgi:hypothetical protein
MVIREIRQTENLFLKHGDHEKKKRGKFEIASVTAGRGEPFG